jgi:hypothetical protein
MFPMGKSSDKPLEEEQQVEGDKSEEEVAQLVPKDFYGTVEESSAPQVIDKESQPCRGE